MVFRDAKIKDNTITLTKEELIEARVHFKELADKRKKVGGDFLFYYYSGNADMISDILKMFEPIDFV